MDPRDRNIIVCLSREEQGQDYVLEILAIWTQTNRTASSWAAEFVRIINLERLGLVERTHERADGKSFFRLTEEGAKTRAKIVAEDASVEKVLDAARETYKRLTASSADAPTV
jgi:DNA-binding transcriptional regulator GbsR (MarR family)